MHLNKKIMAANFHETLGLSSSLSTVSGVTYWAYNFLVHKRFGFFKHLLRTLTHSFAQKFEGNPWSVNFSRVLLIPPITKSCCVNGRRRKFQAISIWTIMHNFTKGCMQSPFAFRLIWETQLAPGTAVLWPGSVSKHSRARRPAKSCLVKTRARIGTFIILRVLTFSSKVIRVSSSSILEKKLKKTITLLLFKYLSYIHLRECRTWKLTNVVICWVPFRAETYNQSISVSYRLGKINSIQVLKKRTKTTINLRKSLGSNK